MSSVIVLSSGGVDSTACISFCIRYGYQVEPLFVDYGQAARKPEAEALRAVCEHFGLSRRTVCVSGLPPMTAGFIQGRNGLLLATALALVEPRHSMVVVGLHGNSDYADCSEGFVNAYQAVFDIYTGGTVRIHAPFLGWSKSDIWEFCRSANVPINLTYSCEAGTTPPCGGCLSCRDILALTTWETDACSNP